jgi:hypothetical protein
MCHVGGLCVLKRQCSDSATLGGIGGEGPHGCKVVLVRKRHEALGSHNY